MSHMKEKPDTGAPGVGRRAVVTRLWLSLALAQPFVAWVQRRPLAAEAILRPAEASPEAFMARAVAMRDRALAAGDQGFGAVVVKAGRIVGQAPSRVVVNGDPTAHAETEAIRDAARRLGNRDLSGCVMYSTSRPCPMCEAAAYWANLDGLRFGSSLSDAGAPQLRRC
jgi:tRNA(Arg) A34 adenosine deaminase TadA